MVNARNDWKLVTFDFESCFRIFLIQAIHFEWLYLATSFSVWRYIFRISKSWFSFKVIIKGQGHGKEKAVTCNSKTTGRKVLGRDRNNCYDNSWSNSELLTFWPWPLTFRYIFVGLFPEFKLLSFEFLKQLAASFSVWRYILKIYRSLSSFNVMGFSQGHGHVTVAKQRQRAGLCSPRTQFNSTAVFWDTVGLSRTFPVYSVWYCMEMRWMIAKTSDRFVSDGGPEASFQMSGAQRTGNNATNLGCRQLFRRILWRFTLAFHQVMHWRKFPGNGGTTCSPLFETHQMHGWVSVNLSVVTRLRCANTVEVIEILFGVDS